jgi:4a-hydroxytetrahydrobiopterin dehydratase
VDELSYAKLSDEQVAARLGALPSWQLEDGFLSKLFEFPSYSEGVLFAAAVGFIADHLNHHPDLTVGYRKVRVSTMTHDANGLTAYDFELAQRIDQRLG